MRYISGLYLFVCAVTLKRPNVNRRNHSVSKYERLSATVLSMMSDLADATSL
jgi:hypothetical protein